MPGRAPLTSGGPKVGLWQRAGVDYERAASDYAAVSKYDKIAASWTAAANDFDGATAYQMESIAWDRAAVAYVRMAKWDKAAQSWESAGAALGASTTSDWANVAYEYAGIAWMTKGDLDHAAADWEKAAKGWQSLAATRPDGDKASLWRAASFAWWNAAGLWTKKGDAGSLKKAAADQQNARAGFDASSSWNASSSLECQFVVERRAPRGTPRPAGMRAPPGTPPLKLERRPRAGTRRLRTSSSWNIGTVHRLVELERLVQLERGRATWTASLQLECDARSWNGAPLDWNASATVPRPPPREMRLRFD